MSRKVDVEKDMDKIKIKIAKSRIEISKAKEIRQQVFQIEQGIDPKLDFDGKDNNSDHFIAYFKNEAVGTARVRDISKETAKLERLAVLKAYRKIGIGRKILDHIINYLQKKGIKNVTLDSQEQAKKFYREIGFQQKGKVFSEVGIQHLEMLKKIKKCCGK